MSEELKSVEVRGKLVDALRLDLIGPSDTLGDVKEALPQSPSRWYLTGFLVPLDAAPEDKSDETANDELDDAGEPGGGDDDDVPEKPAARARYFPSSIGVSVLVPASAKTLKIRASWGDYRLRTEPPEQWERTARQEAVAIELSKASEKPVEKEIPNSNGLKIAYLARAVGMLAADAGVPADARTVSVFLVNRRTPQPDVKKDEAFAFQVQLEITGDTDFLPRPDLRSLASGEWDERVSDLQYRDIGEYSVGHNVATDAVLDGKRCCNVVQTCWIPQAEVERVEPAQIKDVELRMDALATLKDVAEANAKLNPLVTAYREWIKTQGAGAPTSPAKRKATGEELLSRAPYSALSVQQIVGQHAAVSVSSKLDLLFSSGMSPEAVSVCLELTADALSSHSPLEDLVDLVTTGPEAGGVANRSTAVVVSELFRGAEHSVLIAGYAVYQGQRVFRSLGDRMVQCPELNVRMFLDVTRKQSDTSSVDALLARFVHQFKTSQWPNGMPLPNVYCCGQPITQNGKPGSLHAKCIVVDGKHVFISSANFTEAAQERNIEVGLLVQSRAVAERVCRFFDALLDSGYFVRTI